MYRIKYILTPDRLQYHNIHVDKSPNFYRDDVKDDGMIAYCETALVSEAVLAACKLMVKYNIRTLVIDGQAFKLTRD